jgi:hypothetical protein
MEESGQGASSNHTVPVAVDAALGAAAMATGVAVWMARRFARAAAPLGRAVMHPPVLNERLHPARVVEALASRGREARTSTSGDLSQIIAAVVPPVVDEVLDNLDLTALVLERVDIDAVASALDVEAVVDRVDIAAIVERVNIDAIVRKVDIDAIVSQLDIDAIVSQLDIDAIVSQLDIDALVSRVDIDSIVSKVDIDAIVSQLDIDALVSRVDIDSIVSKVDIDAIVSQLDIDAIVSRVDIDAIAKRIDLDAVVARIDVDAIVSRVDVDAIVQRLDLIALAEEVVNGIDLPEIIRGSTGSMASEVVRDVRMQSIDADVAIARLVDRIIRRRRTRRTDAPGEPESRTRANLREPSDVVQKEPQPPQEAVPPKQELRR